MQEPMGRMPSAFMIDAGERVSVAPTVTRRNGTWYEVICEVDKDHCAYFTFDAETWEVMKAQSRKLKAMVKKELSHA